MVVFSTPAVLQCHGWKLGEFLALGKAIIMTPNINMLPHKLENTKEVLIISDINETQQYKSKIESIVFDPKLRAFLEANAHTYYKEYLEPTKVIERLLTIAFNNNITT
jgi:hypothetical protein